MSGIEDRLEAKAASQMAVTDAVSPSMPDAARTGRTMLQWVGLVSLVLAGLFCGAIVGLIALLAVTGVC